MHALPRPHKAISQIRVLIQDVLLPAKRKLVLVLALLQRSVARRVKHGLENDLCRRAAEIEHGVGYRSPGRVGADGVHKVIGRHPRKHALVPPVHDRDGVLRRQRERVIGAQVPPHRIENLGGLRRAQQAQPRRRLDRDGRAAPQRLGHRAHRDVQQRIEAASRFVWPPRVRRQARLLLHERLVLVSRRRSAVVELVDVDARAGRAGVDHESVLHERRGRVVRGGAEGSLAWVWVRLVRRRPGSLGGVGRRRGGWRPFVHFVLVRVDDRGRRMGMGIVGINFLGCFPTCKA